MGQSKGNGYSQVQTVSPELKTLLDQMLGSAGGNQNAAADAYKQFLPGGGGGEAYANAATERFNQQTVPGIMNQFGAGSKTSSALNQALAAGGANLNSDIAAKMAEYGLTAANGLGNLGTNQAQLGSKDQTALVQNQMPFWQSALLQLIGGGGQAAGAYLGRPSSGTGNALQGATGQVAKGAY